MNIGPSELVLILIIFAVPIAAIGVVVVALRAARRRAATDRPGEP